MEKAVFFTIFWRMEDFCGGRGFINEYELVRICELKIENLCDSSPSELVPFSREVRGIKKNPASSLRDEAGTTNLKRHAIF